MDMHAHAGHEGHATRIIRTMTRSSPPALPR